MVRRLRVVVSALGMAALLSYCGGPEVDSPLDAGTDGSRPLSDAALPSGDVGPGVDASQPPEDAGTAFDAGELPDANPSPPDAASLPDAGETADASPSQPDAATSADAGDTMDASSPQPDAAAPSDAGGAADASSLQPDAGTAPDAGHPALDAGGARPDGGDPHAGANKLEYCGSAPAVPTGRAFTVTLNGQTIDFAGGYLWGVYTPETSLYYGDSTFTWTSTDGQYYLELVVHQWFPGSCPVTLVLPNDEVVWNLYDARQPPDVDVFSSLAGASGSLKLDAYDLASGACSVSVECTNCRLAGGGDVAILNGRSVESCL